VTALQRQNENSNAGDLRDLEDCQARQVGDSYLLAECMAENPSCYYLVKVRKLALCSHPLRCEIVKKTKPPSRGSNFSGG